ncbi:MAG TPA: hypothetical protein VLA98_13275 [Solirubrobacteraceae bacterium]|nr:hypothetical protein [Solirubrobacteraceae bacterium]HSD79301.1 hypothetical protein [Solirubrobacteraceae bacterium]
MRHRLLVVANQTVDSPSLLQELGRRARERPTEVTLLVPSAWGEHQAAVRRAETAVAALREDGMQVDAMLGHMDPVCAVQEVWDPRRYDEVLVATLPTGSSRWLQVDLPHRIAKLTGASVQHVEVAPPRVPVPPAPPRVEPREPFLVRLLGSLRISTR